MFCFVEVDLPNTKVLFDDGRVPLPIYEPHFCVLHQDEQRLLHYRSEPVSRISIKYIFQFELRQ